MTQWAYLLTEQLKTRYAVAAFLLRDCKTIVEIGGYKTPISDFVKDKPIHVIDPLVDPSTNPLAIHHRVGVQDWRPPGNLKDFGLIMLGIHLTGICCWADLHELVNRSTRTIIGVAQNWKPSRDQFAGIQASVNKKKCTRIIMDFTEDYTDTQPSHDRIGPHGLRHIYLLE